LSILAFNEPNTVLPFQVTRGVGALSEKAMSNRKAEHNFSLSWLQQKKNQLIHSDQFSSISYG
jgi:hypothetical protein